LCRSSIFMLGGVLPDEAAMLPERSSTSTTSAPTRPLLTSFGSVPTVAISGKGTARSVLLVHIPPGWVYSRLWTVTPVIRRPDLTAIFHVRLPVIVDTQLFPTLKSESRLKRIRYFFRSGSPVVRVEVSGPRIETRS